MSVEHRSIKHGCVSGLSSRFAPAIWRRYWATRFLSHSIIHEMEQKGGPRHPVLSFIVRKGLQYIWFLNFRNLPVNVEFQDLGYVDYEYDADYANDLKRMASAAIDLIRSAVERGAHDPESQHLLADSGDAGVIAADMNLILALPEKGASCISHETWLNVRNAFEVFLNLIALKKPPYTPGNLIGIQKNEAVNAMKLMLMVTPLINTMEANHALDAELSAQEA
jgi:hypothetical protein